MEEVKREVKKVIFDEERCKSCGLCIHVCPKKIIVKANYINSRGFYPVCIIDEEKCTSCAMCARICPDVAIEVYK